MKPNMPDLTNAELKRMTIELTMEADSEAVVKAMAEARGAETPEAYLAYLTSAAFAAEVGILNENGIEIAVGQNRETGEWKAIFVPENGNGSGTLN